MDQKSRRPVQWLAAARVMLVSWLLGAATTPALVSSQTGAPFTRVHFLGNCPIGDGYWEQVRVAGLATMEFTGTHCLSTAEGVRQVIDEILAARPPPAEGKVAVVVGNVGLPGEEHIARAIREGLYVFLIENPPDLVKYGLDLSQHFVVNLKPDNPRGARLTGKELCRIGGGAYQRIVLLYGPAPSLDLRVDLAIERFQRDCPNSDFVIAHTKRGDWSAEQAFTMFRALFLIDSTITTVLSANDAMAEGVIQAADLVLGARQASRLLVSGFDDNVNQRKYLRSRRMFATVNQGTAVANEYVWSILPKLMRLVELEDITSTSQLQGILPLEGMTISTDVFLSAADQEGYLLDSFDKQYMPTVRALAEGGVGPTRVTVGLFDVRIEMIDTAEGSYSATFWLQVSWKDPRLAWNPTFFNGTLQRDHDALWMPYVYIGNMISSETDSYIGKSPLTVTSDGTVTTSFKYTADFGCIMLVQPYPFDIHHCAIEVSVASDSALVSLEPGLDQQDLVDMPESFEGTALVDEVEIKVSNKTPNGLSQTTVLFMMEFMRDPFYVTTSYVLIAFGLNMVSFGSFWVPPDQGNMDRAGLAITTILANAVLQADARSSLVTTWLDVFFNISTVFQFLTFFMSLVTAHYVFDPDYISENEVAEEMAESRREDISARSLALKTEGAQADQQAEEEKYNLAEHILRFTDSILGDEKDPGPDRIGRRCVVPFFLVVMVCLPFFPREGLMALTRHPMAGTSCVLFQVSLAILLGYLIIFITKFSLERAGYKAAGLQHSKGCANNAAPQADAMLCNISSQVAATDSYPPWNDEPRI